MVGNAFLNAHEMCAQEATTIATSMPLRHATRSFVFVPTSHDRNAMLKSDEALEVMDDGDTNIFYKGLVEHYVDRKTRCEDESVKEACLAEYACMWEPVGVSKKNYRRLSRAKILRYKYTPLTENAEVHYKEQIMLFLPWYKEPLTPECFEDADGLVLSYSTWADVYRKHEEEILKNRSKFFSSRQFDWDEIERTMAESIQSRIEEQRAAEERAPSYLQPRVLDEQPDVFADLARDGRHSKKNSSPKKAFEYTLAPGFISNNDYHSLLRSLNREQRAIFNHCLYTIKLDEERLRLFVTGGAGVGKSRLLKAITQAMLRWFRCINHTDGDVEDSTAPTVLVVAPTGKAAWNVRGDTIHAALKFGHGSRKGDLPPTAGDTRVGLMNNFRNVHVSIP